MFQAFFTALYSVVTVGTFVGYNALHPVTSVLPTVCSVLLLATH